MKDKILAALENVIDPDLHENIVKLNMVQDLKVEGNKVRFTFVLTTPACPLKNVFIEDCTREIKKVNPDYEVDITFDSKVAHQKKANREMLKGVKNLIAVSSGKGGVGKSTVSVNLAIALSHLGAKVGLLDADINGPSIPTMLGIQDLRPELKADSKKSLMYPIERYGIKINSIGLLVPSDQPIVWRGPMLSNGLQQLMTDTLWDELDYLVVDLPPGTTDIHLTLCQEMPLTATVVVSTPQQVSMADTIKTMEMFRMEKIDIPILGVVENMSYFVPKEFPDHKYHIFGKDGGKILSEKYEVPLLGQVPLVMGVADQADKGVPAFLDDENHILKDAFIKVAQQVARQVSIINA